MFLSVAVALLVAAAEPPLPTAVVMPLNARNGVTPDAASLITDNLVDEFRRSRAFHRVTSWPEAQALLSLEQARQVVDCDDTGCVTEIVGALNVDFAVVGSLGRLGRHWLINVQLLNVRASTAAASISLRVCASDEGGLLAGVVPTVTALLHEARLSRRRPVALAPEFRDCPEPPPPGSSAPDGAGARAPADEGGGFPVVRVGTAAAGMGAGLVGVLLGVASVAGAVVTAAYVSRLLTPAGLASIRTGSLENEARLLLLWGVAGALGLPALIIGVASLVLVGAGITAVAVAIITGVAS